MVSMGLVHNLSGLIISRVFLGLMEAGFFPGVAFYLSCWYLRVEHSFRLAIFFAMATMAGAFGGLLAFGIGKMEELESKFKVKYVLEAFKNPKMYMMILIYLGANCETYAIAFFLPTIISNLGYAAATYALTRLSLRIAPS